MSRRAHVDIGEQVTTKRFAPGFHHLVEHEVGMIQRAPWAAPGLVGWGADFILLQTLPPALSLPGWRPYAELVELLRRLHAAGVNHRDVHMGNILYHPERGPVLVDWEHATTEVGRVSYDLYGPAASLVQQPQGQRGGPMWVGRDHPMSVGVAWAPSTGGGR